MKNTVKILTLTAITLIFSTLTMEAGNRRRGNDMITLHKSLSLSAPDALELTAEDLVTRVYGVFESGISERELRKNCENRIEMTDNGEDSSATLQTCGNYAISYYGMRPEVTATVTFTDDEVSDFGYIILFPYNEETKGDAVRRQSAFCGCLLQEMQDLGLDLGGEPASEELFSLAGRYEGNFIQVRLIDSEAEHGNGRFILAINVEPSGFTAADDLVAVDEEPDPARNFMAGI